MRVNLGRNLVWVALLAPVAAQCPLTPSVSQPGGTDGEVRCIATVANGDAFFAGFFGMSGGIAANNIVRFDGVTTHSLGGGLTEQPPWAILPSEPGAFAMTATADGGVVVAGQFVRAGGVVCNSIAKWDGSMWSALGTGADLAVSALATMPNGDVVAGGSFTTMGGVVSNGIARWNGSSWIAFGSGLSGGAFGPSASDMAVDANGDLIVVGSFTAVDGVAASGVARWDGASWSAIGSTLTGPVFGNSRVAALANGNIAVGGILGLNAATTFLALWDGATWTAIDAAGQLWPGALQAMPNGDLLAHGQFFVNGAPTPMGRFDGTSWSTFGGLTDGPVRAMAIHDDGRLLLGGSFASAAGIPNSNVAQLESSCPAVAVAFGPACPSSGGANELAARNQPWAGATFRAQATGLPANGVAAVVTGFSETCVFLTQLLSLADADCFLLVEPGLLSFGLPQNGELRTEIELPNLASVVGMTVYHQVVPLETSPQGAWLTTTATNALRLTIGSF